MFRKRKLGKHKLGHLIDTLQQIRKEYNSLVIYGSPTKSNWLGIANATRNLFPENSIEIPQEYSNLLWSEKEMQAFVDSIIDFKFDHVVVSGFTKFFFPLIEQCSRFIKVSVVYHGTSSEWFSDGAKESIGTIIKFIERDVISSIAFIKKDLHDYFKEIYINKVFHLILPTNVKQIQIVKGNGVNIGVFGGDTFNKNLNHQVLLALSVEGSVIHVADKSKFEYLNQNERFVEHGLNLSTDDFHKVLGGMDFNMHLSFNESWGQVVTESLALGVPCITGFGSDVYNYNDHLHDNLYFVPSGKGSDFKKFANNILENKERLKKECLDYVHFLNKLSQQRLEEFMNETTNLLKENKE